MYRCCHAKKKKSLIGGFFEGCKVIFLRSDQEIFLSHSGQAGKTSFSPDNMRNIESHVPAEVLDKMTHFKSVIQRFSLHKLGKRPDYSHPAAVGLQQRRIVQDYTLAVRLPVWGICSQLRTALHKLRWSSLMLEPLFLLAAVKVSLTCILLRISAIKHEEVTKYITTLWSFNITDIWRIQSDRVAFFCQKRT